VEISTILNLAKDTRYLPLRKKALRNRVRLRNQFYKSARKWGATNVYIHGHKANNVILSYHIFATEINFNFVIGLVADQKFNG